MFAHAIDACGAIRVCRAALSDAPGAASDNTPRRYINDACVWGSHALRATCCFGNYVVVIHTKYA